MLYCYHHHRRRAHYLRFSFSLTDCCTTARTGEHWKQQQQQQQSRKKLSALSAAQQHTHTVNNTNRQSVRQTLLSVTFFALHWYIDTKLKHQHQQQRLPNCNKISREHLPPPPPPPPKSYCQSGHQNQQSLSSAASAFVLIPESLFHFFFIIKANLLIWHWVNDWKPCQLIAWNTISPAHWLMRQLIFTWLIIIRLELPSCCYQSAVLLPQQTRTKNRRQLILVLVVISSPHLHYFKLFTTLYPKSAQQILTPGVHFTLHFLTVSTTNHFSVNQSRNATHTHTHTH